MRLIPVRAAEKESEVSDFVVVTCTSWSMVHRSPAQGASLADREYVRGKKRRSLLGWNTAVCDGPVLNRMRVEVVFPWVVNMVWERRKKRDWRIFDTPKDVVEYKLTISQDLYNGTRATLVLRSDGEIERFLRAVKLWIQRSGSVVPWIKELSSGRQ